MITWKRPVNGISILFRDLNRILQLCLTKAFVDGLVFAGSYNVPVSAGIVFLVPPGGTIVRSEADTVFLASMCLQHSI